MYLKSFDSANPAHISAIVNIWNAACGADLAITPRFVEYNTRLSTGGAQAGQIAIQNDQPIGFALASALPNDPQTSPPQAGWVDAIAVLGNYRRQGIGSALLAWAEEWLSALGCKRFRLGGSLRPFVAGYPVELNNIAYFEKRGYAERAGGAEVWDVARDLSGYTTTRPHDYPSTLLRTGPTIRPAKPGDEKALLEFLYREFPNRWRFKFHEFLRSGGRISDWMILLTERGMDGFARLAFEDSIQPYERFYPYRLPRPWGQLGPIGVSADARGRGYGSALLDASLRHLRDQGVRGCVIDWTGLVDFYGKFGFTPYRRYAMRLKG